MSAAEDYSDLPFIHQTRRFPNIAVDIVDEHEHKAM